MARASENQLLPLLGIIAVVGIGAVITILSIQGGDNKLGLVVGDLANSAGANDHFDEESVVTISGTTLTVAHPGSNFFVYKTAKYWNGASWQNLPLTGGTPLSGTSDWVSSPSAANNPATATIPASAEYVAVFTCREFNRDTVALTVAQKTERFGSNDYAYICGYDPSSTNSHKYENWRVIQISATSTPTGSFTASNNPVCQIAKDQNSCSFTLAWTSANVDSAGVLVRAGASALAWGGSGSISAPATLTSVRLDLMYGCDSSSCTGALASRDLYAECALGLIEDGAYCREDTSNTASGSFGPETNPVCTIQKDTTSCSETLTWTTSNADYVKVMTASGSQLAAGASGSVSVSARLASQTFYLKYGCAPGTSCTGNLDYVTINAACANGLDPEGIYCRDNSCTDDPLCSGRTLGTDFCKPNDGNIMYDYVVECYQDGDCKSVRTVATCSGPGLPCSSGACNAPANDPPVITPSATPTSIRLNTLKSSGISVQYAEPDQLVACAALGPSCTDFSTYMSDNTDWTLSGTTYTSTSFDWAAPGMQFTFGFRDETDTSLRDDITVTVLCDSASQCNSPPTGYDSECYTSVCAYPPGTCGYLTTSKDGDSCNSGAGTCSAGTCDTSCTETNGGLEKCDGVDNDCNGQVDDGLTRPSQSCSAGVGVCADTGLEYKTCNGASGWSTTYSGCTASAGSPTENPETSCGNGIDEDCNGSDLVCACTPECTEGHQQCTGARTREVCSLVDGCETWVSYANCPIGFACTPIGSSTYCEDLGDIR